MKIAIIDDDSTMTKQIEDYLQKLLKWMGFLWQRRLESIIGRF